MAKLTPSQIARNCSRGLLPRHEAVLRVIELVGQFGVGEILPQVSQDLLSDVRDAVDGAPSTEEGWANSRSPIIGGTFTKDYKRLWNKNGGPGTVPEWRR
jgi:hypothetical protein